MKRVKKEVAKVLKDIGYPHDGVSEPNASYMEVVLQPTYNDVHTWLWNTHNTWIQVTPSFDSDNKFGFTVYKFIDGFHKGICVSEGYSSPDAAIEQAINYMSDYDFFIDV